MRIGVLGGTGPAGGALALRLADAGLEVQVGSRSAERAETVCSELRARWPSRSLPIEGVVNEEAAGADVVVVATPWDGAAPIVAGLGGALAGKVVVSMANALTRVGSELIPLIPPRGSIAESVQAAAPAARVAAAFHHVPAHELGELDHPVECDVLVCSDHPDATRTTSELVDRVPGLRAVDAGSLSAAGAVEAFTAVLLQVNRRYKTRTTIRLVGLTGGA
ncbi:MAG TPA: NADPH-dependent F420 reductase [Acidimicrobiales bacterium]|nr:NADPH-dependent F420 reductase [Acidimicrobiales bacterium]